MTNSRSSGTRQVGMNAVCLFSRGEAIKMDRIFGLVILRYVRRSSGQHKKRGSQTGSKPALLISWVDMTPKIS